jgi:hypothetical protein
VCDQQRETGLFVATLMRQVDLVLVESVKLDEKNKHIHILRNIELAFERLLSDMRLDSVTTNMACDVSTYIISVC